MLPLMQQCYDAAVSGGACQGGEGSTVAPLSIAISLSVNISTFMPLISELFRAYPGLQLKVRRGNGQEVARY